MGSLTRGPRPSIVRTDSNRATQPRVSIGAWATRCVSNRSSKTSSDSAKPRSGIAELSVDLERDVGALILMNEGRVRFHRVVNLVDGRELLVFDPG